MEIKGYFKNKEQVVAVLPFFFTEENSNIAVESFIDGDVSIYVAFGNGKGWETLESDLARETRISQAWGNYTLGVN